MSDATALKKYGQLATPAIEAGGGKLLVRAANVLPQEEGLNQRTVVIEFASLESAIATYNSPAYEAARKVLGSAAERDFRIVEGVA